MENADIVAYLATGRPASGPAAFEGAAAQGSDGGVASAGAGLAVDQLVGVIEEAAQGSVGLDIVQIRRSGLREATLVAGKYVSPKLYLGFVQPISLQEGQGLSLSGESDWEVEIEYEVLRWLLVNLEGSGSAMSFFLRGRRAY
jgi:autotransporter translocation and assembly factor TamB